MAEALMALAAAGRLVGSPKVARLLLLLFDEELDDCCNELSTSIPC